MKTKKITSKETKPLRHLVLWPHIPLEEDCFIDIDEREDAIHLGLEHDGEIISVCSLFQMTNEEFIGKSQYRLRAMATHPEKRGLNAGKRIVEFAIEILKSKGVEILWCDAREVALGFYSKLHFKTKGDFYNVRNIGPHKLMYYEL